MSGQQQIGIVELAERAEISAELLDEDCSDSDLGKLAKLCDDWELIALNIGLSDSQISAIKEENPGNTELRRLKFLRKWKEIEFKLTYRMLVDAFLKCDKNRKALDICTVLKSQSHNVNTTKVLKEVQIPSMITSTEEAGTSSQVSHSRTVNENESSLPLAINTNIKDKLRTLERNFSSVQIQFMDAPGVTLKTLQSCLSTLGSFQSDNPTPLWEAKNLMEFFHKLKDYCNSQNPDILEDLIELLGDEETKMKKNHFIEELTAFQRETKIVDMIRNYDGLENMPANYKELEIRLADNWRDKTLEDLKNARFRLSSKSGAWLLKLIEDGSLIVTYLVPNSEDLQLSDEQRDYLCSQNVIQITMGGKYVFRNEGSSADKQTLQVTKSDILQSVVESTADKLMNVFETNRREENNAKVRKCILEELNSLKGSILIIAQEQLTAKKTKLYSDGQVDMPQSVSLKSTKMLPKRSASSTYSFSKDAKLEVSKEETLTPKASIKRSHPDTFDQPPPKIPRIPSVIDNQQSITIIDLTTGAPGVEQPSKCTPFIHEVRDNKMISGDEGITSAKSPTISPSDKIISGNLPKVHKQPTSPTTLITEELIAAISSSFSSSKASEEGAKSRRKMPKTRVKRLVKMPDTQSRNVKQPLTTPTALNTQEAVCAPEIGTPKLKRSAKKPDTSRKITSPKRHYHSSVKKRVRRSRCSDKIKKYCRICSNPDCGKCKNCLNKKYHKACVEKPIEQCITYKSQSHIKRTRKQGPQRLKESKFMNQPPLHDSRTSSSSDKQHAEISSESTGISSTSQSGDHGEDFHSQLDKTLMEGSVEILIAKCGVFGPPGSGKSHFKALVSGKNRPAGGRRSTAIATEADQIIGNTLDFDEQLVEMYRTRGGSKVRWYVTNSKKLALLIANTLYNHEKPNTIIVEQRRMSNTRKEIRQNLIKLIERKLKRKPKCLKRMRLIYLVDTGGQPQFQEIMPIFVRGSSVHFLVHRLNESLDEYPRFDYEIGGIKYAVPESMMVTNKVYLEQSLRTISSCTFARSIECRISSSIPRPHFAVIGMFKDKCDKSLIDSKQKAVNSCIQPFTKSGKCEAFTPSRHTDKPVFAIDGSEQGWPTNDDVINDVHMNIEKFTESLKVKVPIRWFLFLNLLRDASNEKNFISRKECFDLAMKEDIMMNNEDVEKALELFDELNLILYFPKILPDIVFISPSFLYDKVSQIIVQSFDCASEDSGITAQERYDYRKTGILKKGVLAKVKSFQHDFDSGFTQDDLFNLLKELCIFAKIDANRFFVPCVLSLEQDDMNIWRTLSRIRATDFEPLIISFSDDYSPRGLFCASVAYLAELPHWDINSDSCMLKRNLIEFQVHEWTREATPLGNVIIVDRLSRFEIYSTCDRKYLCDIRRTVSKALWYAAAKCLAYSPENIDISTGFLCEIDCGKPKPHGTAVLDKDDPQWSMKCIKNRSKRAVTLNAKQRPWFSTSDPKSIIESECEPTIDQLVDEFEVATNLTKWQMIALQLDIDQICVERFERHKEKGVKECFRRVFTKWKKQLKPPFTWAVIVKTLSSSVDEEQHKLADKLRKKYLS